MIPNLIKVRGREVAILEAGSGEPLVYLHGFADVHAAPAEFQALISKDAARWAKVIKDQNITAD